MRAAVPVLLLVALAGCHRVFSASLDVSLREYERVKISDLQNSDESEAGTESEEERMTRENCYGKAVRDQPEQKLNPIVSSVSEGITQGTETQSTKGEKTEDVTEEDTDEAEERFDIEVLKHAAGETDMAVE